VTRKEVAFAAAFYAALTMILAYPVSVHPGSTSLGTDVDVHLYTWTLAWDAHALITRPWAIFDANIFFPYDNTLAYSENLIGSAFLSAPLMWVTGNAVLAMNAVALLSVVLCGLGAYVLARRIGLTVGAALVCGIVFAFSPARFFRFAQLHLTPMQWIPFTLAALHVYFERGRARDLRLALAFCTLQALASLHGAVFLIVGVVVFLVHRALLGTPMAVARRLRDMGVTGALLLVPALLLIPPYLRAQRDMGLTRSLENWMPSPESFLASVTHAHSWVLSRLFAAPINERATAFLFPGYVPIVLVAVAVIGLVSGVQRRNVALYGAITVVALLFAAGGLVSIWPYVYFLPVLNFIRVPSRFFLLAMVGIAVLAAIGCERLAALAGPRRRVAVVAAMCTLLVAEFAAMPLAVIPYEVSPAPVDRWLAAQRKPFTVAEMPVGATERYHTIYMLHSMAHWQKTIHGYSGLRPEVHERLYTQLRDFPDEASLRSLSDLGVTYVVVHSDMYDPAEWAVVESKIALYPWQLGLEYSEDAGRVYRLFRD